MRCVNVPATLHKGETTGQCETFLHSVSMQTKTFTASSVLERLATDEVFRRELIDGVVHNPDLMKSAAPHIIKLLELLKAKIANRKDGK